MPFDLVKVKKHYEDRLREINRLLSDPGLVQLLEEAYIAHQAEKKIHSNGNHVSARKQHRSKPIKQNSRPADYGNQTKFVRREITATNGRFTVASIGDLIRSSGENISNEKVGKVFARFEKNKEIDIVERGKGSMPHQYEKTSKFRAEG